MFSRCFLTFLGIAGLAYFHDQICPNPIPVPGVAVYGRDYKTPSDIPLCPQTRICQRSQNGIAEGVTVSVYVDYCEFIFCGMDNVNEILKRLRAGFDAPNHGRILQLPRHRG